MSLIIIAIIVIALGTIVSAIMLLKQSAKKFDLSQEQLDTIKKRNNMLDEQEKNNEE